MKADDIQKLFTHSSGQYIFARWGRPIAPVLFGVEDDTLAALKGAFEAVARLANHPTTDVDPEIGSNLVMFFVKDWDDMMSVKNLDQMVPDREALIERLKQAQAIQYRTYRKDETGAIKACFQFLRVTPAMVEQPAAIIGLNIFAQSILMWSDNAFVNASPMGRTPDGKVVLRPDIARVIRAAYDPTMPAFADDPSHALRLEARIEQIAKEMEGDTPSSQLFN